MLSKCQDEVLLQQDTDEKQKQEALYTDLTKYWATQQQVDDSREADLKCGLKGALKITTPVAELGPASMQIFQVGLQCEAAALCASKTSGTKSCEWLDK